MLPPKAMSMQSAAAHSLCSYVCGLNSIFRVIHAPTKKRFKISFALIMRNSAKQTLIELQSRQRERKRICREEENMKFVSTRKKVSQ